MFFVHPVRLPHERYENLSKTRIYKLEQAAQANYFTYEKTESELNSQKKKKNLLYPIRMNDDHIT